MIAASSHSSPASAGPSSRRLVSAAPTALPTDSAPAAARPALPDKARREPSLAGPPSAVRTRFRRVSTISVAWRRSSSYMSSIVGGEAGVLDRDVELAVADASWRG